MRIKRILFLIIFLIILLFSPPCYSKGLNNSPINFDFYTYKGKKYKIEDFRGNYILLNLFASYCPQCMVELGILNEINNKCKAKDFKIISLMIDREGIPFLPRLVNTKKLTYIVGLAPSNIDKIFPDFSILPTSYFLDKEGKVIEKIVGYRSEESWLKFLKKYISCN